MKQSGRHDGVIKANQLETVFQEIIVCCDL